MNIINLKTDQLIPYVNNPRHNEDAVDAVASSIAAFGFNVPIVLDKDRVIITGHTRRLAAIKLGLESVPCIIADHLTPAQVQAFRLADNRVAEISTWDDELLQAELDQLAEAGIDMSDYFTDEELDSLEDVTEDEAPDVDETEEPQTQPGDLYILGEHKLLCGDSTKPEDIARLMGGELADLLVTDPPYNVDYEGKTKDKLKIENDKMDNDNFRQFLIDAFSNADTVMKQGAVFYIWH